MNSDRAAVLFVTGKGGTGKSSVASLLGRGAELQGLKSVVVDLGSAPGRTRGSCIRLDRQKALGDFLTHIMKFRYLSNRLMESRTFTAIATAAPGLDDLVTLSAITDLASAIPPDDHDLIVVDAPATGHSLALLAAPSRVLKLVGLGPVAGRAAQARDLITNPTKCRTVVVSTAEELSVTESISLSAELRTLDLTLTPAVVNGVYPDVVTQEQAAWISANGASADALLHRSRRMRQLSLIETLESSLGPSITLPLRFGHEKTDDTVCDRLFSVVSDGLYLQ